MNITLPLAEIFWPKSLCHSLIASHTQSVPCGHYQQLLHYKYRVSVALYMYMYIHIRSYSDRCMVDNMSGIAGPNIHVYIHESWNSGSKGTLCLSRFLSNIHDVYYTCHFYMYMYMYMYIVM